MYGNNEVGIVQLIVEIGELLKEYQLYFYIDVVQVFGLLLIDVKNSYIDFLFVLGYKFNGLKGIGFLYVSKDVKFFLFLFGGE